MDNKKIILAFYVSMALLVWFLGRSFTEFVYANFYEVRRLAGIGVIREVLPFVLGIISFGISLKHARMNTYMEEVVSELKKVTWPSREDVVRSTIVVIVCIFVAGVILSVFDLVWGKLIGFLLNPQSG